MNDKNSVDEGGFAAGQPQGKMRPLGGQRSTRSDKRGGQSERRAAPSKDSPLGGQRSTRSDKRGGQSERRAAPSKDSPLGGQRSTRSDKRGGQQFGKVAVLMGGASAEREISLMSGNGVLKALQVSGVDAHAFDPSQRDLSELRREGFARCFIALHGRLGEDGTVQGALELLGIPYTGSGVMASAIAVDKVMTKRVWLAEGLPTPRYQLLRRGSYTAQQVMAIPDHLGLPLIVKPAREGSSIGVLKVAGHSEVESAVEQAAQFDTDILCEQCIVGDEVTCPVIGSGDDARALPVIRIVAPDGNYDYQNKYFTDDTQYIVPCGLPQGEEQAIQQLVIKAYRVLDCRGWGRVDVMIDGATRAPYLLEINTSPGMTSHSLVPMSARADGISYEDLCLQLLALATLDYTRKMPALTTGDATP
jgi:D-alanine-D-alanine ligase